MWSAKIPQLHPTSHIWDSSQQLSTLPLQFRQVSSCRCLQEQSVCFLQGGVLSAQAVCAVLRPRDFPPQSLSQQRRLVGRLGCRMLLLPAGARTRLHSLPTPHPSLQCSLHQS